jgi:hypothetical protein
METSNSHSSVLVYMCWDENVQMRLWGMHLRNARRRSQSDKSRVFCMHTFYIDHGELTEHRAVELSRSRIIPNDARLWELGKKTVYILLT